MTDAEFDARYADALRAPDAVAAVRALAAQIGVHVDDDGVRIAALQVARLRFERIVRGDPSLAIAFDDEPERFARVFKAYHAAVVPTAADPRAEAAAFASWWAASGSPRST